MIFNISPLDEEAMAAALARHGRLAKPAGSLGRLEALGVQLASAGASVEASSPPWTATHRVGSTSGVNIAPVSPPALPPVGVEHPTKIVPKQTPTFVRVIARSPLA